MVSIAASIQNDLMQSGPSEWTVEMEERFTDELGPLPGTITSYQEVYEAIIQTAINFGVDFHLARDGEQSVADFVLMFKAVMTYQGWTKFYGDAGEPNTIEGVLVNKPDPKRKAPLMTVPNATRNTSRRSIDTLCELFQYKRGYDSLREDPANPVAWSPNRESWQDEYPLFYHAPDLDMPTSHSAVLFLGLDMDVFNAPKNKMGTPDDPLMR